MPKCEKDFKDGEGKTCDKEGTHSMSHGELYYCDEHYEVRGECAVCEIEIHEDWDCGDDLCRPCGKRYATCEKDSCTGGKNGYFKQDKLKNTKSGGSYCPSCFKEALANGEEADSDNADSEASESE